MVESPRILSSPVGTTTTRERIDKAATGIAGFDAIATGGVPRNRPTLVCGAAGCGKTLFAVEFLVRGAREFDEPGVMISFEESPDEIADNVASIGFDIRSLIEAKKLAIDHIVLPTNTTEAGDFDLEGLFARIHHAASSVNAKRLVLDTTEILFGSFSNENVVRSELSRLFRWTKEQGLTTVITGERGSGRLTRYGLEEYVSDCVILLEHEIIDRSSSRRLRIVKYRGTSHGADEYPLFIDNYGFSVLPVTEFGFDTAATEERVSVGVDDLDRLFGGGGIYRGSGLLISGGSGTGKTTLAAHSAAAACERGERVLVFAFEESSQQVLRNMRSIGLDLRPYLASGQLRYESRRPSRQGLEAHLVRMQRLVEKFDPALVIVDPISALMHSGSANDARTSLVRLADHLKSRDTTAVFTSLGEVDDPNGSHGYVSSIMDTWIQLRAMESSGERNRGLHVLKSRGMAHSNQIHELLMSADGVRLLPPIPGAVGLTGARRVAHLAEIETAQRLREREIESRRASLQRKRQAMAAQLENLQAEFAAEEAELRGIIEAAELEKVDEERSRLLVEQSLAPPKSKSDNTP